MKISVRNNGFVRSLMIIGAFSLFLFLVSYLIIPVPHFNDPTSTVIESRTGRLLGARIAKDGQWRFPPMDSIPKRFETCLLHFEDRSFYRHFGIDPRGILRATKANYKAGRVVQGGSTISMQVARMLDQGRERSFWNKFKEALVALHLEVNLSKSEILKMYSSNAPFGGNVVGLETAAWRYFGCSPEELSWSESATLAVLPNAPALIYPGRGQELLRAKRDRLLRSLYEHGYITKEELQLSVLEELPKRPERMPTSAMHLLDKVERTESGVRKRTSIDFERQQQAQRLVNDHVKVLGSIEVYNAALIIMDTRTQEEIVYIGNSNYTDEHANSVDCITASRSSGSILKPLLYMAMIDAGELTPYQMITDIPTQIAEYSPENYHDDFDGVVPAEQALTRSLNVPFVRLLREYGVGRFQKDLKELGLSTLTRRADDYGLSLMLGGAEVRLDELTRMYAEVGAVLSDQEERSSKFDKWSIHHAFQALQEVTRPEGREYQRTFAGHRRIAWKTGTSFGNRDAWAIGVTPDHTIGVWVGNADGEGRSGLTGVSSAAPLLFDALDLLPYGDWFREPVELGNPVEVCEVSGFLSGSSCPSTIEIQLSSEDYSEVGTCVYHKLIYVNEEQTLHGSLGCAGDEKLRPCSWFVLPPIEEWYYKTKNNDYRPLPPLIEGCVSEGKQMDFIYPNPSQKVYIPKDMDGSHSRVICKLAHREVGMEVYWYLDKEYLGSTNGIHEMPIHTDYGEHRLTVIDKEGVEARLSFEVLSKD